jgi:hypothetical protein
MRAYGVPAWTLTDNGKVFAGRFVKRTIGPWSRGTWLGVKNHVAMNRNFVRVERADARIDTDACDVSSCYGHERVRSSSHSLVEISGVAGVPLAPETRSVATCPGLGELVA